MSEKSSRRERLDTVLSVSAAAVALSAMLVSAYQAKITREQQKMSAWPRLSVANTGGNDNYAYIVQNVGVGPALVRSATLTADGRYLHTWSEVLARVAPDAATRDSLVALANPTTVSVQRGLVLLPGLTDELVRVKAPLAKPLRAFFNDARTRFRVCYCSVYNDCWVADSQSDAPDPEAVSACPDDAGREFRS